MGAENVIRIISYTTSSLVIVFGIVLLLGFFLPPNISESFQFVLGTAMILYGAFRVSMIRKKKRHAEQSTNTEQ